MIKLPMVVKRCLTVFHHTYLQIALYPRSTGAAGSAAAAWCVGGSNATVFLHFTPVILCIACYVMKSASKGDVFAHSTLHVIYIVKIVADEVM